MPMTPGSTPPTGPNAVLQGISRLFQDMLASESEEALGRLCLTVAEALPCLFFCFFSRRNPWYKLLSRVAHPPAQPARLPRAHEYET